LEGVRRSVVEALEALHHSEVAGLEGARHLEAVELSLVAAEVAEPSSVAVAADLVVAGAGRYSRKRGVSVWSWDSYLLTMD
jgi:hypothetical protein